MADTRFFHKPSPIAIGDVASITGAEIIAADGGTPDLSRQFSDITALDLADEHDISFLDNVKYADMFCASKAGACFVRPKFVERAPKHMLLLVTDEPYAAYALAACQMYPYPSFEPLLSPDAMIAKTASIGQEVRIDASTVIGENVTIGDHCWIGANVTIDDNVSIGHHCRIGASSTISHSMIGNHVILHRGVHIGQDGFGFAPGPTGITKVPQLGRVIINDDVDIGSGTCIDRGAGPDTIIGQGCKIDNLVQIGHNVQLGNYVVIAALCGISGSTQIGDGVMIGGQVGISGHVQIGDGVKIAARSGVMTNIPPGSTYGGAPAIPIKDWHRQTVAISKLVKKRETSNE